MTSVIKIKMLISIMETAKSVNQPQLNFKQCLTQLSDVVLGDVTRKSKGSGEQWGMGSSVIQPEALMLTHLE